jgi:hypothetical protein
LTLPVGTNTSSASNQTVDRDETRFAEALEQLRGFTVRKPGEFVPALRDRCAAAGVAVVIVPPLPGVRAYGATRWLHSTKALIQLSLRGKTDDHLWFTFFHEAGHVLKHGKRAVFVEDGDPKAAARDPREAEADVFACELLIPATEYENFWQEVISVWRPSESSRAGLASHPASWPGGCNTKRSCRFRVATSSNAGLNLRNDNRKN